MLIARQYQIRRTVALVTLLLVIFTTSANAQKIRVEFDKTLDFASFKTFAWAPLNTSSRPMLVAAIAGAVESELTARGLKRTTENPDLYIEMYGAVDSDAAVTYSDLYSGYGGIPPFDQNFLVWGAMPGAVTTAVVHKGQLVVDLIDADRKKIAWRGVATEKLSDNRKKVVKQVNTAVEKMFQQYPSNPDNK